MTSPEIVTTALLVLALLCWSRVAYRYFDEARCRKVRAWRVTQIRAGGIWVPIGFDAKKHMKCERTEPDDNQIEQRVKIIEFTDFSVTYETLTGFRRTRSFMGFIKNHIPYD